MKTMPPAPLTDLDSIAARIAALTTRLAQLETFLRRLGGHDDPRGTE